MHCCLRYKILFWHRLLLKARWRSPQQVPLTKRQLKDWIADGVLVLPINDFPADFHMGMFKRAEELHSHNQALMAPM